MRLQDYPDHRMKRAAEYVLDDQIGYVLRRVTQRHLALFSESIPQVTTTQFAVLAWRSVSTSPTSTVPPMWRPKKASIRVYRSTLFSSL